MMPWRKIAGLSAVASMMLGCTITTSDGAADSGTNWNETGGATSQGGASSTGGAATGGVSTVLGCSPQSETPDSCGECLQSPDNTSTSAPGMCTDYKSCATVSGCTAIVNSMSLCMATKALDAGGTTVPDGSDVACRASTSGMSTSDTSAAAVAAQTFWTLISLSSCDRPCWVEGS